MRTALAHRAALITALAVGLLVSGCGQDGTGPLDSGSRSTSKSAIPEPTIGPVGTVDPAIPAPSSADATGGIPVSDDGVGVAGRGDVVVDLYLDFMCPYCGVVEQVNAADLSALVDEGGVTVVYHPVAILDSLSEGTAYSSRAVNAVAVVADLEPEFVPAFINALLAEGTQPPEGTAGLSDDEIAQIAQGVGVSVAVTDQFTVTADFEGMAERTFVPWTEAVTALIPANPESHSQGTPTVLIDRRWFGGTPSQDWRKPGVLAGAVEAAQQD